jgi:hypothetical protein
VSLGQSVLTAAALIVLTILVIGANRLIFQSQEEEYTAKAKTVASEIAKAIIDESMKKKFDELEIVPYAYFQNRWEFTDIWHLGPSTTEAATVSLPDSSWSSSFRSMTGYDDFDDYNGYVRIVDAPLAKGFIARCKVYYVNNTNLNAERSSQGYFKRLDVTVEHPVYLPRLPDPITGTPQVSFSAVKTY